MTIRVDIASEVPLAELVAHVKAGEEVLLTQGGQDVAALIIAEQDVGERPRRAPGAWVKYGPLQDPDLFLRPDPELEEAADGPIFPVQE